MSYMAIKMQAPMRSSSALEIREYKPLQQQPAEKKATVIFHQNLAKTAACVLQMIGVFFFLTQITFHCTWLLIMGTGHFLQGSNDSADPTLSHRLQAPINISVLFPSLQVSHKFSDEFIEWGICDLSKFTFTWQAAQKKFIPGYHN